MYYVDTMCAVLIHPAKEKRQHIGMQYNKCVFFFNFCITIYPVGSALMFADALCCYPVGSALMFADALCCYPVGSALVFADALCCYPVGSALVFVAYPEVLNKLPGTAFWSIVFFLMLITLGLDSQVCIKAENWQINPNTPHVECFYMSV